MVFLSVACANSVVAAYLRESHADPNYQTRSADLDGEKLEGRLKWLGTVIEGNTAQVGKRSAKYDSYKYEAFRFDVCSMGWRETHEAFEAETFLSKESQELKIPLSMLDQASVRVDKIGKTSYLVSFTTLNLKPAIVANARSTYQDRSEEEHSSLSSGYGIYFQSDAIARRVGKSLVLSIRSCQRRTHS